MISSFNINFTLSISSIICFSPLCESGNQEQNTLHKEPRNQIDLQQSKGTGKISFVVCFILIV